MVDVPTRTLADYLQSLPSGGMSGVLTRDNTIRNDLASGADIAAAVSSALAGAIGVSIQAYSANLDLWSSQTPANYLTTAAAVAGYQPKDADLTSWAAITRVAGFDSFAATADLVDPNADRILFWDDSAGKFTFLTPGTNLSISGTSLNAVAPAPVFSTAATTATLTPNVDLYSGSAVTAQSGALAIAAPTGTPVNGQQHIIRLRDNGSTRAVTWDAAYEPFAAGQLPTATTANKTMHFVFLWNSATTKWDLVTANPTPGLWS